MVHFVRYLLVLFDESSQSLHLALFWRVILYSFIPIGREGSIIAVLDYHYQERKVAVKVRVVIPFWILDFGF
jgi:hypothetical protein